MEFDELNIKRNRLYVQVVEYLQEPIITGAIKPGGKLPTERQLVEKLGVSRTVVREALKTLEEKGLIKTITGSGTYVAQMDTKSISNSLSILLQQRNSDFEHLHEIRQMLEIEVAGLSAERATSTHIASLELIISEMETAIKDIQNGQDLLEKFVKLDFDFHNSLAIATENPLFILLLQPISELLLEFRRQASRSPGAPEDALDYHREILQLVKNHDVLGCRRKMHEHLVRAREWASHKDQN
jgi:GntR family transcriptional regulator, transcriptional repressor for pyruvate dehydrogenase complex